MTIEKKIKQVLENLTWRVEHERGDRDLEITSDPWSRTHYIKIPVSGPAWRSIEYLHELAHATLAERHHLISTAYFISGTQKADIQALTNPIRCASDWFADDLLMKWTPEEESAEIHEHADYGFQFSKEAETDEFARMVLGQSLAQAVKYLGAKIKTIPRIYRPTVDVLLSVDPSLPTVQNKRKLINVLASLTCRQRVHLDREDGMDLWRIKK